MADTVYIVAPVPGESERITEALVPQGVEVRTFDSAEQLLSDLSAGVSSCACVVVPVDLPGMGVRRMIEEIRRRELGLAVVVLARDDDLRAAIDSVRSGATEFVEHPPSPGRLRAAVRRALAAARLAKANSRPE